MNTLLNENRAIVSAEAGTTRDTIEEILNIQGILFRLVDTAGIRMHTRDMIETMGVERSIEKMNQSDLVVYLFDVHEMAAAELQIIEAEFIQKGIRYLLAGNKTDVNGKDELLQQTTLQPVVYLSAKENRGVDRLKQELVNIAVQGDISRESTVVTNARHHEALQKLGLALEDVINGLNDKLPGDLLALDIRQCLYYLGNITGEVTHEDQLDYIFSKFCIGK